MGKITRISGPVVEIRGLNNAKLYEIVKVGDEQLIGEIIRINRTESDHISTVQVYEETTGLKPREQAFSTGNPLSAELGPGLLTKIYDGIQRPLPALEVIAGNFITRGISTTPLDEQKKWEFIPILENGAKVSGGSHIGEVKESNVVTHKIMVPPDIKLGTLSNLADRGNYTILDEIGQVKINGSTIPLTMKQLWPVRRARPVIRKLEATIPLITGQRIFDTFFPIAKGGVAAIPGGFGTGKTVSQHQLAKWSDATVVVYIGCGERGNEMADVLEKFPQLKDFRSGKSLMDRTIIIANTSDMPIAAREASVYMAATLAEYYRDMGYDIALMVDSTSRWAEALREISGRLEEMPGEEGYPAYLASKLAGFYSRACYVKTKGSEKRQGSVTIMGSVSPPGGDFSEPVTRSTLRLTRVFWALDFTLAHRRHFPAINWVLSHSEYTQILEQWYEKIGPGWLRLRQEAMSLLREEEELREIVSLIGAEILDDKQRIVFEAAKMIKEFFLLQNSFHPIDIYCPMEKTYQMLRLLLKFSAEAKKAIDLGVPLEKILALGVREDLGRMKTIRYTEFKETSSVIDKKMDVQFDNLIKETEERGSK
ncbi:MAG: V-type ATP synthase subunit A [Candidatus Heimdallarchaeota archaeon]|nr:V-type ATP synthase subunit A [Candidatus Heimdallarchaeota archaeon]